MLTTTSAFSHADTVARLRDAIRGKGLTVFAEFDHGGAAAEVAMELPGTYVIVFGSPRAGTPLMQADPRVGIELPLRVLVWEQGGETHLGHADPRDWDGPYDLGSHAGVLEAMAGLLARLVSEAAGTDGP